MAFWVDAWGAGVLTHRSWEEGILWYTRSPYFTMDQLSMQTKKPILNKVIYQRKPDKGSQGWDSDSIFDCKRHLSPFRIFASVHVGCGKIMFLLVHLFIYVAFENTAMN